MDRSRINFENIIINYFAPFFDLQLKLLTKSTNHFGRFNQKKKNNRALDDEPTKLIIVRFYGMD